MQSTDQKLTNSINNIYYLLQKSNLKIGDLESYVGVSTGYLSRQNKEGSTGKTSLEFALKAAEFLNVNISDLVDTDLNELTPDEQYLLKLIKKVIDDSKTNDLKWKRESESFLLNSNEPHVLFEGKNEFDSFLEQYVSYSVYRSLFSDNVEIDGDLYRATLINTDSELIITKCKAPQKNNAEQYDNFFELYLVTKNELAPLCSSLLANEALTEQVDRLYKFASENYKSVKIDTRIKSILDNYIDLPDFLK